jgi:hypothetical protein
LAVSTWDSTMRSSLVRVYFTNHFISTAGIKKVLSEGTRMEEDLLPRLPEVATQWICIVYQVLICISLQRQAHRLPTWLQFDPGPLAMRNICFVEGSNRDGLSILREFRSQWAESLYPKPRRRKKKKVAMMWANHLWFRRCETSHSQRATPITIYSLRGGAGQLLFTRRP